MLRVCDDGCVVVVIIYVDKWFCSIDYACFFFSLFSFSLTGGERGRREMRIVDTLSLPRLLLYSNIVEGISLGHTFISSVIVRYSNQV